MNYLVTLLLDDGRSSAEIAEGEVDNVKKQLERRVPDILSADFMFEFDVTAVRVRTTADALGLTRR